MAYNHGTIDYQTFFLVLQSCVSKKPSNKNCCWFCQMLFKTKSGLNKHIGKMHNFIKSVTCEACGKSFKHKKSLNFHYKQVHLNAFRAKCPNCLKTLCNNHQLL